MLAIPTVKENSTMATTKRKPVPKTVMPKPKAAKPKRITAKRKR